MSIEPYSRLGYALRAMERETRAMASTLRYYRASNRAPAFHKMWVDCARREYDRFSAAQADAIAFASI